MPVRTAPYSTGSTMRKEINTLSRFPDSHKRAMTMKEATGTV